MLTTAAAKLLALGFEPDLGPAFGLTLKDGSTLFVSAIDADGEPDCPVDLDAPAIAQRLVDPFDYATLIQQTQRPTLREVLAEVRVWIDGAVLLEYEGT
jgi:hypothetical protein